MAKNLIIGAFTGYNYNQLKPWVESIETCGFKGHKVMIVGDASDDTCAHLIHHGFELIAMPKINAPIHVARFWSIYDYLHRTPIYDIVVTTDVKDVYFQKDPCNWIINNMGDKSLVAGSESIRYQDEEWGSHNLMKAFGALIHEHNKENLIYNAGTISGQFDTMSDLFLNIYMLCNSTNHFTEGGGGPDQAALNILLNMKSYKDITNFAMSEDGYAAQLGTTGPQIAGKYGNKLVEKNPILVDNMICTSEGVPFSIVHQYDRVPEWKKIIEAKYE